MYAYHISQGYKFISICQTQARGVNEQKINFDTQVELKFNFKKFLTDFSQILTKIDDGDCILGKAIKDAASKPETHKHICQFDEFEV